MAKLSNVRETLEYSLKAEEYYLSRQEVGII
jgi:hypothetical protein